MEREDQVRLVAELIRRNARVMANCLPDDKLAKLANHEQRRRFREAQEFLVKTELSNLMDALDFNKKV